MDHVCDLGSHSSIKIHLLTENRLLRELTARLLARRAGMCVVGVTDNLQEALEEIVGSRCEILLTDCLTTESGETLLSELSDRVPRVRVVLFGMPDESSLFLKSAYMGVFGYVLKDVSASGLIAAVRAVARGEAACPPKLCMSLIQHLARELGPSRTTARANSLASPHLTRRQLELMGLVARGLTNKEIAATLNLSEFTVKNHIRRILKQVDADDRYAAVDAVRATGYLPPA